MQSEAFFIPVSAQENLVQNGVNHNKIVFRELHNSAVQGFLETPTCTFASDLSASTRATEVDKGVPIGAETSR